MIWQTGKFNVVETNMVHFEMLRTLILVAYGLVIHNTAFNEPLQKLTDVGVVDLNT